MYLFFLNFALVEYVGAILIREGVKKLGRVSHRGGGRQIDNPAHKHLSIFFREKIQSRVPKLCHEYVCGSWV